MICPGCNAQLSDRATFCGCGWQKRKQKLEPEIVRYRCAHETCGISAMCRIKVSTTAWANLCWQHYDAHYAAQARANCAARGLHTTAQLREAFKAGTAALAQKMRKREVLVQREPGEDWDEDPIDEATIAEKHALAARVAAGEVGPEARKGAFDD